MFITVTNVRMFCRDTDPFQGFGNSTLTGDGTTEGVYTAAQYCPKDSYVCGINSQLQPYQHNGDNTALDSGGSRGGAIGANAPPFKKSKKISF